MKDNTSKLYLKWKQRIYSFLKIYITANDDRNITDRCDSLSIIIIIIITRCNKNYKNSFSIGKQNERVDAMSK